jgi:8-oxo-dGTP pyrophosphatase MutT (NUDIX family)
MKSFAGNRRSMAKEMETVRSCGFLVVRGRPIREFLLMKHKIRWDLPKGHIDPGETDLDCALRELWEETGIPADALKVDPTFQFVHKYPVRTNRVKSGRAMKTLVIFLGQLLRDVKIKTTEHPSYAWLPWEPPHRIQEQTIDPLLKSVEEYVTAKK